MKIRKGFVSNSSSSSFICSLTGKVISTWDTESLADYGYKKCLNGHIIPEDQAGPSTVKNLFVGAVDNENWYELKCLLEKYYPNLNTENELEYFQERDYLEDFFYEGEPIECPICNMEIIPEWMVNQYLLTNKNIEIIIKEIKEKFNSYKEFSDYVEV